MKYLPLFISIYHPIQIALPHFPTAIVQNARQSLRSIRSKFIRISYIYEGLLFYLL